MTDKEIIINGIDVSECKKFLAPSGCDNVYTKSMECERNSNCYFKQLKRAEQKFKKIEEKCKEYASSIDIYDESDILAGEILQIIEGKKMSEFDIPKEKVLFNCHHVDELTAYKMIKNKEKITPDNAPTCDLELAIIANSKSPYGFSAIYKDNKGELEYMGVGHSGVCSIITALLKELHTKEQECEELHNRTASIIYRLTGGRLSYSTYTLEGCEDAYADQLRIDVERATKELSEENEQLKSENFTFEELIKTQENLIDNYKKVFDEIEKYCIYISTFNHYNKTNKGLNIDEVIDIISKAKDGESNGINNNSKQI